MINLNFIKATKRQAKLRMALIGPSGSGKTYTALNVGTKLGDRVAVIDTERGSASKYADLFAFDVLELDTFSPMTYVEAIKAAEVAGYDVLVIDSLSHAWMGKDGALEQVDNAKKRSSTGNSFTAWRDITPQHNALVDAILGSRCHIIATMRSKTEYVQEKDERTGKTVPRKIGLAPVQRDGLEYEFDVIGDMNLENDLVVSKTRCPALSGAVIAKPGKEISDVLKQWLTDGVPASAPVIPANAQKKEPTPRYDVDPLPPLRYNPEQLRVRIAEIASKSTGDVANGKRGAVVNALDAIFSASPTPADCRHQLLHYLTGKASSKDIPDNVMIALHKWLNMTKDTGGQWLPDAMAVREALAAFNFCQPAQDQLL